MQVEHRFVRFILFIRILIKLNLILIYMGVDYECIKQLLEKYKGLFEELLLLSSGTKTQSSEVWIQYRDVLDKGITIADGDYLSYGDTFFEILKVQWDSTIFGQIEHSTGYVLSCKQARIGLIDKVPFGPTDESYSDPDAVQETFVQQRGFENNKLGPTADKRALIEQGKLDLPISGAPAEVSKKGSPGGIESSFYADEGDKS